MLYPGRNERIGVSAELANEVGPHDRFLGRKNGVPGFAQVAELGGEANGVSPFFAPHKELQLRFS